MAFEPSRRIRWALHAAQSVEIMCAKKYVLPAHVPPPRKTHMDSYSLFHVSDAALLRDLGVLVRDDRSTTARLLAHVAEVDARRLYAPAGYPSMFQYCVHELHFSEDVASKRIHAARVARDFPVVFEMLADGRLHLSAVCLLAPHLKSEMAADLLAAAAGRTRAEIERLLAERFPQRDVPTRIRAVGPPSECRQHAPGHVGAAIVGPALGAGANRETLPAPEPVRRARPVEAAAQPATIESAQGIATPAWPGLPGVENPGAEHAPGHVSTAGQHAPGHTPAERPRVRPLAPERYALQLTMGKSLHDKLRYAQELLSHQVPSGDVPQILERALDALIANLEKRKFGACSKPRKASSRRSTRARHIPAEIKRAVWQRDQGRCTFVSDSGHRCESRRFLEYDHVNPVARGGRASLENIRLRCRAHNQFEAGRAFGHGFMHLKRKPLERPRVGASTSDAPAERDRVRASIIGPGSPCSDNAPLRPGIT
jgi:hypothetical protein